MKKEPPIPPNLSGTTDSEETDTLLEASAKVHVVGTADVQEASNEGDETGQVTMKPAVSNMCIFLNNYLSYIRKYISHKHDNTSFYKAP